LIFRSGCFRDLGREPTGGDALEALDDLKFSGNEAGVEVGADLGMGDLAQATTERVANQSTFIRNRLALEVLVTCKGERFSNPVARVNGLLLILDRSRAARTTASAWCPKSAAGFRYLHPDIHTTLVDERCEIKLPPAPPCRFLARFPEKRFPRK